ncbi:cell division cycle-associated protein 2 isoform X2 [Triplophysa dalaica]|uniref:cell division cycle-associated protein 2 isoform X2 n=1 Tax=Triplophysa dalaica TaxID=1582913 RepID=UPI0024DF45D8|nr:cell division cycle-associated protein 2 isoform X2 [Triplophysa dalaica]
MEVAEAMDSRPPLAALSLSQQNTEADVDFSKLTPSQFGISTQSFLPSSKIKDKSRLAQLKARRRSTIGVRGSPETNSLICFRAKQAAKTPPRTPQLFQGSPFVSRCDSLKKKMEAFQCLMEDDEEKDEQRKEEECVERTLGQDSQNEKEIKLITQSPSPFVTPPPSKKRCRAPRGECEDKITETALPCPTLTTQEEQRMQSSESHRPLPELCSDSKNELISSPMLSRPEIMPSDVNEISSVRKKRVRFGLPLSPEFFDKTLPPSTPLQKGGTPMCPPSSTGKKRSLLKTPQRFEGPLPQPDFNSPQSNGASPIFVIDRRTTGLVYSDDVFDKIGFPSMDEESPSNTPSENCKDTLSAEDQGQPQAQDSEVMNAAFQVDEDEPSASQMEEKLPSATSGQPPALSTEVDLQSVGTSEQQLSFNASTQPTRSRCRKRKQPGENVSEKRKSSRTAAASASGKMKNLTAGVKKRFGTKEVNRSLYGKRDFASKNPLLSPIFETKSANFSSTPTQTPSEKLPGAVKDDIQTPTLLHSQTDRLTLSDATLTNEIKQTSSPAYQSDTGMTLLEPSASTESPAGRVNSGSKALKARRGSGRPARQRRSSGTTKRRKFSSSAIDSVELEGETGEIDSHELFEAIGLNQNNSDGLELHESEHSETPNVVPNDPMSTERSEQKTPKRCGQVQKVLKSPCVKIHVALEADERIVDETEFSDSKAAPTEPTLASWQQTDFNIDDILKPVAKSRGSVRRSLRNRRSVDLKAVGLAWVDHTSPEFSKVGRRRTRGRLSGVSESCVTLISEEPTPDLAE